MNIEQIKIEGSLRELRKEIDGRIFQITNKTFSSYMHDNHYTCLTEKITDIRDCCDEIMALLHEVYSIDQTSK